MKVKIFVVAGLLGAVIMASDVYANIGGGGRHGHGGSGGTSGQVFNGTNENGSNHTGNSVANDVVGVPEPSSLYALGTALVVVGATGWVLRRKK
jgi:hypothetical protein